ncbi:MAG: hypothetical protein NTZ60_08055 [Campylobacterales bacterium]|nr:hypothetical protein [Campylobacterales bacterium]
MIKINWDEFKSYKQEVKSKDDNFIALVNFMRSYYNMSSPREMFESFASDDLAVMMLEKRDISSPSDLESYLGKI